MFAGAYLRQLLNRREAGSWAETFAFSNRRCIRSHRGRRKSGVADYRFVVLTSLEHRRTPRFTATCLNPRHIGLRRITLEALGAMANKAHPGGRRKRIVVTATPEADQQWLKKGEEDSTTDSNPNNMQAVMRVTEEISFVHLHLSCGHLLTIRKGDLKGERPKEMKCWACAAQTGKSDL